MRLVVAVLIIFMMTGCVNMAERKATFAQGMDTFVGKNADDLVIAKGPPTSTFRLSSGGQVFEYAKSQTVMRGGGSYTVMQPVYVGGTNGGGWLSVPTQQSTPVSSYQYSCKLLFKISAANKVESWSSEGNSCY